MGERSIRRAVRDGRLIKLWQGTFAVPVNRIARDLATNRARNEDPAHGSSAVPTLTRLGAAQLTLGRPVIACLHTAARLYGFATEADPRTHVLGAVGSSRDQLVVHRTPSIRPNLRIDGFGVVDPAETAVRLAALAPNAPRALACLDAALRSGHTTRAGMAGAAQELHVTRVGLVRALVVLADARSESPPESWLRWVCHDAGFPPPEPQFWVKCPSGAWFRLDLAWPEPKLGLEYDGVEFHTGAALTADRARRNALTAEGWTILSVTAPMLWDGRPQLVEQVSAELLRRGAR